MTGPKVCVRCGREGTRSFTETPEGPACTSTKTCQERAEERQQAAFRFRRRNSRNGHSYTLDGEHVVGVTTVLGVLDKSGALTEWAAKQSASYAIEHWDELGQLPMMDRWEKIRGARWETNKAAVVRGNRIHAMGEDLAHGREVDVPPEYVGPVEAYARFLDAWQIETVQTETPVCHSGYRYAGTFDAIGKIGKLGGVFAMIDVKTSPRVYSEVALQLQAYRFADLQLGDQPNIAADTELAFVAHVQPDTVDLVPIVQDDEILRTFLYLLEVHEEWIRRTGWDHRNEDTFSPPVLAPLYPEGAGHE